MFLSLDVDVFLFAFAMAMGQLSPGPDMFVILKNTLNHGLRLGLFTIAGICLGVVAHTTLVVMGLSIALEQTAWLFRLIQAIGAVYLFWIAGKLLASVFQASRRGGDGALREGAATNLQPSEAFREGLLTNLLNVKVMVLFASMLAPFAEGGKRIDPAFPAIMMGQAALIWPLFAWVMQRPWMRRAFFRRQAVINGFFSVMLILFAGKLAWSVLEEA